MSKLLDHWFDKNPKKVKWWSQAEIPADLDIPLEPSELTPVLVAPDPEIHKAAADQAIRNGAELLNRMIAEIDRLNGEVAKVQQIMAGYIALIKVHDDA